MSRGEGDSQSSSRQAGHYVAVSRQVRESKERLLGGSPAVWRAGEPGERTSYPLSFESSRESGGRRQSSTRWSRPPRDCSRTQAVVAVSPSPQRVKTFVYPPRGYKGLYTRQATMRPEKKKKVTRRSGNGRGCNALRTQKTYARSDWTNAGEVIGAWSCRADLPLVPCVASKLCRHRLRAQPPLRCSPCACCPSRCDQTTAAESAASEILDYGGRTKFSGDQTAQWAVVEARTGRCPRRVERSATKSWLVQKKPTAPSWCESALWRLRVAQLEVSARMSGSRFVAAARRGDYRSRINHLHMATGPASLSINSSSVQSTKPTRGEGTANAVLGELWTPRNRPLPKGPHKLGVGLPRISGRLGKRRLCQHSTVQAAT